MESMCLARDTVEMLLNSTSTQVLSAAKTPVHTLRTSLGPQREIILHSQSSLRQPQTTRIAPDTVPVRVEKDNLCIHQMNIPMGPKSRRKKNTIPPKTQRKRRETKQKRDPFGLFLIPTYENFRPLLQSPPKRIQVERIVLAEKQTEDSMRQAKKDQATAKLNQSLFYRSQQAQFLHRACEQAQILSRHLRKSRDATFTYGFDGEMLLVTPRQPNRAFPYKTKVVVQPQEADLPKESARESKSMRCARGEAFKSAVLQTTNLSRISVGEGDDVGRFMKSNQLFNNNHARQTSTTPYIRLNRGATYTELHRPATCFENRPAKNKLDAGLQVGDQ